MVENKVPGQGVRPAGERCSLRIASWNVGSLKGRSNEVVETLTRRNIDICCLQETRWKGSGARMISGKDSNYKLFWIGNTRGIGGVGIFLKQSLVENVFEVTRVLLIEGLS